MARVQITLEALSDMMFLSSGKDVRITDIECNGDTYFLHLDGNDVPDTAMASLIFERDCSKHDIALSEIRVRNF